MTKEEAVALLKQVQIYTARSAGKASIAEALGLAISALEERKERKKGKWIVIHDDVFADTYYCSECKEPPICDDTKYILSDFCPSCGADMRTKETDFDYQRAIEQLEHDILYEPTFNPDDGSM